MRRTTVVAALLPALLCSSAAATAQTVTRSELISYDTLHHATGGDDLTHEFSQKPDTVRVTVQCKLKRGEFSWRVESPDGEVVWDEKASAKADLKLTEEFPGQAGEWRIVIDYRDTTGRYHIKMEQVTDDE